MRSSSRRIDKNVEKVHLLVTVEMCSNLLSICPLQFGIPEPPRGISFGSCGLFGTASRERIALVLANVCQGLASEQLDSLARVPVSGLLAEIA